MTLLNIHTHHPLPEGEATVRSYGLHPWHLTKGWKEALDDIEKEVGQHRNNIREQSPTFIGECGLDRLCDTPYPLQIEAFKAQISLSERLSLPLIIHCVRAIDDVLQLKHNTCQSWVFHGFRGKPQQLQQLLDHGFYVSFGFRHHPESLSACPLHHLFLETDDIAQPIAPLYATASQLLHTNTEALNAQLWHNLDMLQQSK